MLISYHREQLGRLTDFEISDELEQGNIIYFPECPIPLPREDELQFIRDELPARLALKNVSYHPEADAVRGLDTDQETTDRVHRILTLHSKEVEVFLKKVIPSLTAGWTIGTCSFRPVQERGRDLKPHASNELIHFDAGAYGATNGDRILRFFVNVNPQEDRVWATKGAFPEIYRRCGSEAGVRENDPGKNYLRKKFLDHLRTGIVRGLKKSGLKMAHVLDSSPYDRRMRKFHNYMKDAPEFQQRDTYYQQIRFRPFSAWMVFTDMLSHASISGQHAFVDTRLVPLTNCRLAELAPINILKAAG